MKFDLSGDVALFTYHPVTLNNGEKFPIDAVFIEIGADPRSKLAKAVGVEVNEKEEACYDCHKNDYIRPPLTVLRHRLFKGKDGNNIKKE